MFVENIIVGGGPAGVQLGYFMKKGGDDYIIFERSDKVGSFFEKYPHTSKLISINKRFTGSTNPDFNLRHDWNSLLSEEGFLFREYSKEYYPDKRDLVRYLNDFANKFELNIKYNSNVLSVDKNEEGYELEVKEGDEVKKYYCMRLIVATGINKPAKPLYEIISDEEEKIEIKHYGEYDCGYFEKSENLEKFENKKVLIIGDGNSGYELANTLNNYCSSIVIVGNYKDNNKFGNKPPAFLTHYAGDLRSVYLPFLDTFFLKSLNGINGNNISNFDKYIIEKINKKYYIYFKCKDKECNSLHYLGETVEEIIFCTGWKFDDSLFKFKIKTNKKYPIIKNNYESINNDNLFFIGSLMHSLDHKKSSGGFIHGFRYLIEFFHNINIKNRLISCKFPLNNIMNLTEFISYRINNCSALYQMYGVLCDFFTIDYENNLINYFKEVPLNFIKENIIENERYTFIISLQYNKEIITDYVSIGIQVSKIGTECRSSLLHLVISVYSGKNLVDEIHFDEDLLADFSCRTKYTNKIFRTIKMFL